MRLILFYIVIIVVLSYFTSSLSAAKSLLPPWLTPCKGSDPNISECAEKEANKIIPILVKGYPPLNFPVLEPFNVSEINIQSGREFNIVLKDVLIYGFGKARAFDFKYDFKGHTIGFKLEFPKIIILGNYEIDGRLIVLPITGKGPGNFTIVDGIFDINFSYSLYEKKGIEYGRIDTVDVSYVIKRLYIRLDNLFNGNKELGDAANVAANHHWQIVLKELDPAIKESIGSIAKYVFNNLGQKVPYGDIFANEFPE